MELPSMNVFREALRRPSAFVVRKGGAFPKQSDVGGCFTRMGTSPAKWVLTSYASRFLPPRKIGPKTPIPVLGRRTASAPLVSPIQLECIGKFSSTKKQSPASLSGQPGSYHLGFG